MKKLQRGPTENSDSSTIIDKIKKIIVEKQEHLGIRSLAGLKLLQKDYKEISDKLILNYLIGKSLKELILGINDPFELFDLCVILEDIIDFLDRSSSVGVFVLDHRLINFVEFIRESDDFQIINIDEEVIF